MIEDNIREQIKVILSGVSGIGMVHDHNRLALDWNKLLDLFKDTEGRINACMFARQRMAKRVASIGPSGQKDRAHLYKIRCIMGMADAQGTGIIFDNLLTGIELAFEGKETLNGTCRTINPDWGPLAGMAGIQIDLIEERMFGNVLCHYAELQLCALERR